MNTSFVTAPIVRQIIAGLLLCGAIIAQAKEYDEHHYYCVLWGKDALNRHIIQDFYASGIKQSNRLIASNASILTVSGESDELGLEGIQYLYNDNVQKKREEGLGLL